MSKSRKYQSHRSSGVPWLGDIPSGWAVKPIKYLATYNDEVLPESADSEAEITYVEISDVSEYGGVRLNASIRFKDAPSRARRIVRKDDVLVSTVRTYLRAVAAVRETVPNLIASTGFAVLRAAGIEAGFLRYAMLTEYVIDEIISRSVGVSYPAINASDLVRVKLPVPPPQEQLAIAAFLDCETAEIDTFIAHQKELIVLLAERRAAVIKRAVTKGLDRSAVMKDSGLEWLGAVPAQWKLVPLRWKSRLITGITPATTEPEYYSEDESDFHWIRPEDLNESGAPTTATKYLSERGEGQVRHLMPESVLLCCIGATLGKVGITDREASTNQQITAVVSTYWNGKYLFYSMQSARQEIEALSVGNTIPILNNSKLGALRLPHPEIDEQKSIAAYLDGETAEIDAAISDAKKAIDLSKERRAALISAAVTGKIDVRKHNVELAAAS